MLPTAVCSLCYPNGSQQSSMSPAPPIPLCGLSLDRPELLASRIMP